MIWPKISCKKKSEEHVNSLVRAKWLHCEGELKFSIYQNTDDKKVYLDGKKCMKKAMEIYEFNKMDDKIGLAFCSIGLTKHYRSDESKQKFIKEFFQSMDIYLKRIKNTKNAPDIQRSLHLALLPTFFCGINNLYMGEKREAFCIFDTFFDLWKKIFPESKVMKIENDEDLISNMLFLNNVSIEEDFLSNRKELFDEQQCEDASLSNFFDNLGRYYLWMGNSHFALKLLTICRDIRVALLPKDNVYVKCSENMVKNILNKKKI